MSLYTLMALGPFRFSIDTAAHDELARSRAWKWASQEVVGAYPALQFTGPEAETINLKGTTYPGFKVAGLLMIEAMAVMAAQGKPFLLVSGYGLVLGFWVIERIDQNEFNQNFIGIPRKIEFNIVLKRYSDTLSAIKQIISDPASAIGL